MDEILVQRVAFDQAERAGRLVDGTFRAAGLELRAEPLAQTGRKPGVELHRGHRSARPEQASRQDAQPWADLEDPVARRWGGGLEDPLENLDVGKEVLRQRVPWPETRVVQESPYRPGIQPGARRRRARIQTGHPG